MKRTAILGLMVLTMSFLPACEKDPVGENSGTEQQSEPQPTKKCPEGFMGNDCEYCAPGFYGSECKSCDCDNGTCNDGITGNGSCSCAAGYRGPTCAIVCMGGSYNPCNGQGTCLDDGTCQCNDGIKGVDCSGCDGNFTHSPACDRCVSGFFGGNCENQCPGMGSDRGICSGHGTCNDGIAGTGVCTCATGFAGNNCEKCADGYRGKNCEIECAGGANNPCNNNGICNDEGKCECYNGFKGDTCSIECAGGHDKPCGGSENGTCLDDGTCQCKGGIKGSDCSGCEEHKTNYPSCDQCDVNYYGAACDKACPGVGTAEGICNGHGSCDDGVNGKGTCTCTKGYDDASNCTRCADGYRGSNCSIECAGGADNPCNGHGTCKEDGSCSCTSGWEGDACETEVQTSCNFGYDAIFQADSRFTQQIGPTYCGGPVNKPCNNHGTCNTTTQKCECNSGYTGWDCNTSTKSKAKNVDYSVIGMLVEPAEIFSAEEAELQAQIAAGIIESADVLNNSSSMDKGGDTYSIVYPWDKNSDGSAKYQKGNSIGLFNRAEIWAANTTRCYEVPSGDNTRVENYTESEAYDLYKKIAELTTGHALTETANYRNVVGIRGAYPGTFSYNGNLPNRYNDTIVLLWKDSSNNKRVLEFPVTTDTGANNHSADYTSGSLMPNRHYAYKNGKHNVNTPSKSFDALRIREENYQTFRDINLNGFPDSKRNGMYKGWNGTTDYNDDYWEQNTAHNIHFGQVTTNSYGNADIGGWSAGCQVIPGWENWKQFIDNAWTNTDDKVSYYLVDVRDIDKRVWNDCTPNGTHECPYVLDLEWGREVTVTNDTSLTRYLNKYDRYYCENSEGSEKATNYYEKGSEVVYVFTLNSSKELPNTTYFDIDATISYPNPSANVDVDIHLLRSDDPRDCIERNDSALHSATVDASGKVTKQRYKLYPGRYYLIVDTYSDAEGTAASKHPGPYSMTVKIW